jgi:hypothetical protein
LSENRVQTSDMNEPSVKDAVVRRIRPTDEPRVWSASDFADLGPRDTIDKTLQRLVADDELVRVERGLYTRKRTNPLTKRIMPANYRDVLDALERRDATAMLIDGMTAANDLGLTTAVPARIIVHTDSRRGDLDLGGQHIEFRKTAPKKLFWAGRPAMRLVQALLWMRDQGGAIDDDIRSKIRAILEYPDAGAQIVRDLKDNFAQVPTSWLQDFLRPLLFSEDGVQGRE